MLSNGNSFSGLPLGTNSNCVRFDGECRNTETWQWRMLAGIQPGAVA